MCLMKIISYRIVFEEYNDIQRSVQRILNKVTYDKVYNIRIQYIEQYTNNIIYRALCEEYRIK